MLDHRELKALLLVSAGTERARQDLVTTALLNHFVGLLEHKSEILSWFCISYKASQNFSEYPLLIRVQPQILVLLLWSVSLVVSSMAFSDLFDEMPLPLDVPDELVFNEGSVRGKLVKDEPLT